MNIILLLIFISIVFFAATLWALFYSLDSGEYEQAEQLAIMPLEETEK